jgi:hypothetical protein
MALAITGHVIRRWLTARHEKGSARPTKRLRGTGKKYAVRHCPTGSCRFSATLPATVMPGRMFLKAPLPGMRPRAKYLLVIFLAVGSTNFRAANAAGDAICAPVAAIDGPRNVVAPIEAILSRHGIRVSNDQLNCRAGSRRVRAAITPHQDKTGFTLTTMDDSGRTSMRVFVQPATAASLIESWALDEDALLLAPPIAEERPPSLSAVSPSTVADDQRRARLHLYGAMETSMGADRSWWMGVAMGACVRSGPLCTGLRGRSTRDTDVTGASSGDSVMRTNTEILFALSWLFQTGGLLLAPTAAVGAGWLRTTTEGGLPQDAIVIKDRGLRVELSVLGRWPISRHLALGAELGGTWSPGARTTDTIEQRAVLIGEPGKQARLSLFCSVTP